MGTPHKAKIEKELGAMALGGCVFSKKQYQQFLSRHWDKKKYNLRLVTGFLAIYRYAQLHADLGARDADLDVCAGVMLTCTGVRPNILAGYRALCMLSHAAHLLHDTRSIPLHHAYAVLMRRIPRVLALATKHRRIPTSYASIMPEIKEEIEALGGPLS